MNKEKKQEKIEKKLTQSFFKISAISAFAAFVGILAIIIISARYSYSLKYFGFAQGDIGEALFEFADVRSSLRAAIGYEDQEAIDTVVKQHEENKAAFEKSFAEVENTIVSKDGRETYDAISDELDDYWELDERIMELGATTDVEKCRQAQELALSELSGHYNSIYSKLEELLEVKINQGNTLAGYMIILECFLIIVIIIVIIISLIISTKFGKKISKGISEPLAKLGERLKTFSQGDLSSPFPMVETGDEIELMEKDAKEMANNLNTIIHDIDTILGEMASGNYTVKSKISDKYTGDFHKLFKSMLDMKTQMTETLTSIGEASNQVSAGSGELANAAQCLAEGATDQAHSVQVLHSTISEITTSMENSAENAGDSYNKAQQYADRADNSLQEMNTMMAAMERINDTSKKIGNIISEIESIASQTNLLSLNASIEAARAGESGRGFAVVADEIRELADQSAQAAVDTRELIESSLSEVSEGNLAAERAANAIESVVSGIKQIAEFSNSLKNVVEDQADAMRNAENDVNQINEIIQSNAATAEEASATSEELFAQANVLDELVGQFQLEK